MFHPLTKRVRVEAGVQDARTDRGARLFRPLFRRACVEAKRRRVVLPWLRPFHPLTKGVRVEATRRGIRQLLTSVFYPLKKRVRVEAT